MSLALLAPAAAVGGSIVRTQRLRSSFERQFWDEARYPNAEPLGAWEGFGRLIAGGGAHCDFAAQAVYGTTDDYELVEAHYARRTIAVGAVALVAFDVQPVSDRALSPEPLRGNDPDAATRDVLIHTGADLARARSFPTVFIVQAVSWGHAAWLDWRCR